MLHEESEFGEETYLAVASGFLIGRVCCIGAPLVLAALALPGLVLILGAMSRLSLCSSILKFLKCLNLLYYI